MQKSVYLIISSLLMLLLSSCSVIEKSSMHGFDDGYYKNKETNEKIYVDLSEDIINVYPVKDGNVSTSVLLSIPDKKINDNIKLSLALRLS